MAVPEVLVSGDHGGSTDGGGTPRCEKTRRNRPDLTQRSIRLGVRGRTMHAGGREGRWYTRWPPMNKTDLVEKPFLRNDIPDFRPGDSVKVHVRVVEGNRERVQVFQGVVLRRGRRNPRDVHGSQDLVRGRG